MKIVETAIAFARLPSEEKHRIFQQVWAFDQQIFPNAAREQLQQYVYDKDAVSVPIVQYRHDGKLIGQNIIPILTLQLAEKPVLIVSSRAGFLPEYRRRSRTLSSAMRVVLNYRIRNPVYPLWFVTTLMQPKVYTLFASRPVRFFPRAGRKMPAQHAEVLRMMHSRRHEVQVRGENIFAHSCDLPRVTPEQLIRLRSQADAHQQFFMQHAPDYFDGMGLMCICRLDFRTICAAALNLAFGRRVS